MPFSLIPFLLLAIPIAEIAVFILIGGQIGILWTFATILLTAVLGSILLRFQGFQILNRVREETGAGRIPGKELGHGVLILIAGVLLLTPGFVTDALGFMLFIPGVRTLIWKIVGSRINIITPDGGNGPFSDPSFSDSPFSNKGPFGQASRPSDDGVVDLDRDEFTDLSDHETKNTEPGSGQDSPWKNIKDNNE